MNVRSGLLALVMVLALLVEFALAGPFPKARNFMSESGYARWQRYLTTGQWR